MIESMKRLTPLIIVAALFCVAGAKKNPPVTVRFHAEAVAADGAKFSQPIIFMNPPHKGVIDVIPFISEREIIAFSPFKAKNGTNGAYFKLDYHGTALLEAFTTTNMGKMVVVIVNGRQVVDLVSDKPITDGIITIPNGLTEADIEAMRGQFRIIGKAEDPKKRQKENVKKLLSGDTDLTQDPELGPSRPTATPIPVSTLPAQPKATPNPPSQR